MKKDKRLYRPDFTIKEPPVPKLIRVEVDGKPMVRINPEKPIRRVREATSYYLKGYDVHDIAVMMGITDKEAARLTKKQRDQDVRAARKILTNLNKQT